MVLMWARYTACAWHLTFLSVSRLTFDHDVAFTWRFGGNYVAIRRGDYVAFRCGDYVWRLGGD
jgi:hypothetical protein